MARNAVQFQKGLSEPAFEQLYGTEEQCRAIVIASSWPNGFECPVCGAGQYSVITTRHAVCGPPVRRQFMVRKNSRAGRPQRAPEPLHPRRHVPDVRSVVRPFVP